MWRETVTMMFGPTQFDYSNSAIIKPPELPLASDFRYYFMVVDSRDRNRSMYPNPSQYVIDVPCDISNIKTATLISAFIPNVDLNVTENENSFQLVVEDQPPVQLQIPSGKYDGATLTTTLQGILAPYDASVSYNTTSHRFTFQHRWPQSSVHLDFAAPNSAARQLGFARTVYPFDAGGDLLAPFVADLGANASYIFLTIGDFGTIHGIGNAASSSFALLSCTNDQQVVSSEMFTKYFNPTMARLSKLRVRLVDYYGNLVDFQNRDHYFIVKFGCLKSNIRF
jgi:hypothetical protein